MGHRESPVHGPQSPVYGTEVRRSGIWPKRNTPSARKYHDDHLMRRPRTVATHAAPVADRRSWRWSDWLPAAIVFTTAMSLRVAAISALGPLPLSRSPQLDSLEYLMWAQHLAERGFVWPEYPEHAPGYSFFVGALLWLFDGSLTGVRVVQAASHRLLRLNRADRRTDADAEGGTCPQACSRPCTRRSCIWIPRFSRSRCSIFFLVWSLDSVTSAGDRRSRWFLAGLTVGLASIVRPTGLVMFAAYVVVVSLGSTGKVQSRCVR